MAPRGNCQEDWTRPDDDFYSVPSWDILGLQGLSKDHGPHKVRHYYAILIKEPQERVVDCRSPDKDGGICKSYFIVDHSLLHFSNNNQFEHIRHK